MALKTRMIDRASAEVQIVELADAHCHLDLLKPEDIRDAITSGVRTMITNGVDTASNMKCMELADGKHVFAAAGIDPEHALGMSTEELEFNIGTIRSNAHRIVGIGEIGLDYVKANSTEEKEKQKGIFAMFLGLAEELRLPVSVHSRGALDDVMRMIRESSVQRAHIHFFEGDAQQVKLAEKLGCTISVPPFESSKRIKALKEIALDRIMAESDAPVAGASPKDTEKAVRIVAAAKGISFERAAEALTLNTKGFFRINAGMMRL